MARPFQFHKIENFPVAAEIGAEWQSIHQIGLNDESIGDSAKSIIRFDGQSQFNSYYRYKIRHETEKECWIRYDREDRKRAIFVEEFNLYTPPNFTYVIIAASTKTSRELLKRIGQQDRNFSYAIREIDLQGLKDYLHSHVRGGWFKDLEIADVSTAAIFGQSVSESDEWEKYESSGTLSSLVIEFSYSGTKHSVNVGSSGAITLYPNYDEKFSLGLIEKFNEVVIRYQTEIEPKHQKDSKKIK